MITGTITHEEATIRSFMRDPEYAKHLLGVIIADGDEKEIKRFEKLYEEAQARMSKTELLIEVVPELQGATA